MPDGYAPSGNDKIFYRDRGSGQAVIFIHAGVADSRMWLPQLESDPSGYRYVAYDQRGFGNSAVGTTKFKAYEDALAVMDYLAIESAVVVGCSMGGGVALDVAIEKPQRVEGLVLIGADSPGFEAKPFQSPQWPDVVKAFEAGDFERVADLEAEIWLAGHGRDIDDVDPEAQKTFREMDLVALRNEERREELEQPGPERATGILGVDTPTLVMVGQYDLPSMHENAQDLASKLSRRGATVIEGTAHLPSLERPNALNTALVEFLDSLT